MADRFQFRRGTSATWTSQNPILAAGEPGFESDTNKLKIGNGSASWAALSYLAATGGGGGSSGGITVINAKTDHGAVGDGTTNDTSAIQSALDACYNAGGGIVFLPVGVYRTNTNLLVKSDVWLMGAGYGNTRIQCDPNANYDVITVGDGTNLGNGRFVKVTDIEVDAQAGKTAGAQIHVSSGYFVKIKDCYLNGGYDGVVVDGNLTTGTEVTNSVITAFSRHGVIFQVPNNGGQTLRDTWIGGHNSTGAGILWTQRDSIFIEKVLVLDSPIQGGFRIEGNPAYAENIGTGSGVGHISNCHFDAGDGPGVYVNKNGIRFGLIQFVDCYTGYNAGHGLHIVNVDSLSWIGGKIMECGLLGTQSSGIHIQGGTNIHIDAATILRNNNAGITLANGVSGVRLTNNRVTTSDLGMGGGFVSQQYGFVYGGSNTNCIITGNDLRGNGTAATSGTTPTGAVANNLP